MPLIVMCGRPATGKSKRALELKDYIENTVKMGHEVIIINEESLGMDRSICYSGNRSLTKTT